MESFKPFNVKWILKRIFSLYELSDCKLLLDILKMLLFFLYLIGSHSVLSCFDFILKLFKKSFSIYLTVVEPHCASRIPIEKEKNKNSMQHAWKINQLMSILIPVCWQDAVVFVPFLFWLRRILSCESEIKAYPRFCQRKIETPIWYELHMVCFLSLASIR